MIITIFEVITNFFYRGEVKDNVCYGFGLQMYNWKLPQVNSLFILWGMVLWQDTIFTKAMDRILWSIKTTRSAVFPKKHLCEKTRKCASLKNPSFFSNKFWATRRRAMEKNLTRTQNFPNIGWETLPTTALTPKKTDDAGQKIELQDIYGSKPTLDFLKIPYSYLIFISCRIETSLNV